MQNLTESLNSSEKEIKHKDKEVNNMKTKSDNLEDSVRRLKQEKSASEKELKSKDKEIKKVKTNKALVRTWKLRQIIRMQPL